MKKFPVPLDRPVVVLYVLQVDSEIFGPYKNEAAARKAASKGRRTAEVLRVQLTLDEIRSSGIYNGDGSK